MDKITEKRSYPRIKRNLPLEIMDLAIEDIIATKDISSSGVNCLLNKEIPLMTKVGITLMLPFVENDKKLEKKVDCKGIVVRSLSRTIENRPTYEIAIFFDDISDKNRELISKFVESSLQVN